MTASADDKTPSAPAPPSVHDNHEQEIMNTETECYVYNECNIQFVNNAVANCASKCTDSKPAMCTCLLHGVHKTTVTANNSTQTEDWPTNLGKFTFYADHGYCISSSKPVPNRTTKHSVVCNTIAQTQYDTDAADNDMNTDNDNDSVDEDDGDSTYYPTTDTETDSEDPGVETETDEQPSMTKRTTEFTKSDSPVHQTTTYLVYESELYNLFKFCPNCGSHVKSMTKTTTGTMLTIGFKCEAGCNAKWRSQPMLRRMPAGNLLLSASIILSGSTFAKVSKLWEILQTQCISKTQFNRIQNSYLCPVINDYWTFHQTAILSVLSESPVAVCGDARCDSPGFSAKYSSYTVMDMKSSLIIDQQLVQVTETGNSVRMEKEGLDRCLEFLIQSGLSIETLATDRHLGIQAYMRLEHPEIDHQFDVWHLAKSVTKNLTKRASKGDASALNQWIQSISNHLYWCAQTAAGNADLLVEKWLSCTHHVVNIHTWNGGMMSQCEHGEYPSDDRTAWLKQDSPAHDAMKSVVQNKKLLKDIRKLSKFCHTGNLEVYHSLVLKYAPKRNHFHYPAMRARLQLAALDHNHNVDRALATDKNGQPITHQFFSKARKQWVVRNVYCQKQYSYIDELLQRVVDRRSDRSIGLKKPESRVLVPITNQNIATKPKPTKAEALATRRSRMRLMTSEI